MIDLPSLAMQNIMLDSPTLHELVVYCRQKEKCPGGPSTLGARRDDAALK